MEDSIDDILLINAFNDKNDDLIYSLMRKEILNLDAVIIAASQSDYWDVIKYLLDEEKKYNKDPTIDLLISAVYEKQESLSYLMKEINYIPEVLIWIVMNRDNKELLKILIESGLEVNSEYLNWALENNKLLVAEFLIKYFDESSLELAIRTGILSLVKDLLDYGAKITHENIDLALNLGYSRIAYILSLEM